MRIGMRWTPDVWDLVRELVNQRLTGPQISKELGVSLDALQSAARDYGVSLRMSPVDDHRLRERWAGMLPRMKAELRARIEEIQ